MDVCAVDYLNYGIAMWKLLRPHATGFSRGVEKKEPTSKWRKNHDSRVLPLLSLQHYHRLRLKVFLEESDFKIPSVNPFWNSANWFEREVFDLFEF